MSLSFTLLCYLDGFAQTFEDWEHQNFIFASWRHCEPGKYALPEMFLSMILFRVPPSSRNSGISGSTEFSKIAAPVSANCPRIVASMTLKG